MSFSSILNQIDQFIKLKPWLQHVGYMLVFLFLIAIAYQEGKAGLRVLLVLGAGVATAISYTGFVYNKVYQ